MLPEAEVTRVTGYQVTRFLVWCGGGVGESVDVNSENGFRGFNLNFPTSSKLELKNNKSKK